MKLLNALIIVCLLSGTAYAQPINYQGRLSDKSGTNVNGTKNFSLRIFGAKTGGKQIYEENVGAVTVNEGAYSFNFGENGKSVVTLTESIAFADGEKQIFNYTVKNTPVLGEIKISGGGYSWTEDGSSDATFFTATANKNSGAISAIFLTGAPAAGSEVAITYDHNSDGVMGALSRGGQAWLEISVDGETLSPRERLVAVPFALYAKHLLESGQTDSLLYHARTDNNGVALYDSNSGDWKSVFTFHLFIPKGTMALRVKMRGRRMASSARFRIGNNIGKVGHAADELVVPVHAKSGWQDLSLQIRKHDIGGASSIIEEIWVYTKND